MKDCIFCKIISREIPSKIILQNDQAVVIEDINPKATVHLLIIPKKHIASLNDLNSSDRKSFLPAMYELADEIAKLNGFRERGYKAIINNQAGGGQVVFHLHLHLLSGKFKEAIPV